MRGTHKRFVWVASIVILIGSSGCDDTTDPVDNDPPAIPRGVFSITGDREVELRWYPNTDWDLRGYRVYRGGQAEGYYDRIGFVSASSHSVYQEVFFDQDVYNGRTYYYAGSSVDYSGNESELSLEEVFDTPRPDGFGVELGNFYDSQSDCAYDFSDDRVTDFDVLDADIAYAYDRETDIARMWGLDDPETGYVTELQDAGFAQMDDITWAPPDGWSEQAAAELIEGHVYVAWTRDDHYAKFRIVRIRAQEVEFDWAYQVDVGNQELSEDPEVIPMRSARTSRRRFATVRR